MVGEATNGAEAVRLVAQVQPDVVLMDLQKPGGDGLATVRQIAAAQPEVRVLVETMFQDDASIFAAMHAGARGYVLKEWTTTSPVSFWRWGVAMPSSARQSPRG